MIDATIRHLFPSIDDESHIHIGLYPRVSIRDRIGVSYSIGGVLPLVVNEVKTMDFCVALGMSDEDSLIWVLKFGEYLPTRYKDGVLY